MEELALNEDLHTNGPKLISEIMLRSEKGYGTKMGTALDKVSRLTQATVAVGAAGLKHLAVQQGAADLAETAASAALSAAQTAATVVATEAHTAVAAADAQCVVSKDVAEKWMKLSVDQAREAKDVGWESAEKIKKGVEDYWELKRQAASAVVERALAAKVAAVAVQSAAVLHTAEFKRVSEAQHAACGIVEVPNQGL